MLQLSKDYITYIIYYYTYKSLKSKTYSCFCLIVNWVLFSFQCSDDNFHFVFLLLTANNKEFKIYKHKAYQSYTSKRYVYKKIIN